MVERCAENNLKQAQLPESATIIDNPIGTACGFRVALGDACLYFTPGVPREMKTMMRDQILPQLSSEFGLSAPVLRRLHSFGISEARVDQIMNAIERPAAISLGFRAHLPLLEIKVTGEGPQAESLVDSFIKQVPPELAEFCVARDQQTQALNIATMLRSTGATLSTAESCTGGLLADAFIQFAGSSEYFVEGVVAYANQAKIRDCAVDPDLIESYGGGFIPGCSSDGGRCAAAHRHQLWVVYDRGWPGPAVVLMRNRWERWHYRLRRAVVR